jgi:hypothetical protein
VTVGFTHDRQIGAYFVVLFVRNRHGGCRHGCANPLQLQWSRPCRTPG